MRPTASFCWSHISFLDKHSVPKFLVEHVLGYNFRKMHIILCLHICLSFYDCLFLCLFVCFYFVVGNLIIEILFPRFSIVFRSNHVWICPYMSLSDSETCLSIFG